MSVIVYPGDLEVLETDAYCKAGMTCQKLYDDKLFRKKFADAKQVLNPERFSSGQDILYAGSLVGDLIGEARCCKDLPLSVERLGQISTMVESSGLWDAANYDDRIKDAFYLGVVEGGVARLQESYPDLSKTGWYRGSDNKHMSLGSRLNHSEVDMNRELSSLDDVVQVCEENHRDCPFGNGRPFYLLLQDEPDLCEDMFIYDMDESLSMLKWDYLDKVDAYKSRALEKGMFDTNRLSFTISERSIHEIPGVDDQRAVDLSLQLPDGSVKHGVTYVDASVIGRDGILSKERQLAWLNVFSVCDYSFVTKERNAGGKSVNKVQKLNGEVLYDSHRNFVAQAREAFKARVSDMGYEAASAESDYEMD